MLASSRNPDVSRPSRSVVWVPTARTPNECVSPMRKLLSSPATWFELSANSRLVTMAPTYDSEYRS